MCSGEQRGARSGPREPDGRVSDPGLYPGEGKGLTGGSAIDNGVQASVEAFRLPFLLKSPLSDFRIIMWRVPTLLV